MSKTHIDKVFFDNIETEEQAYILGFLYADAAVIKTNKERGYNRIRVTQCQEGLENLKKIHSIMKISSPIKEIYQKAGYKTGIYYILDINSTDIVKAVARYGLINLKTNRTVIPNLKPELIRHFIRGYFDGDGCISTYRSGNRIHSEFSFTGNDVFMTNLQNYLIKQLNLPLTKNKEYKDRNATSLRYGGLVHIRKIYHFLYDNSNIYNSTKFKKFQLLFSIID